MVQRFVAALSILLFLGPGVRADDWPQFRGPRRDGVSLEKGLLKVWPKGGPKKLWMYKEGGLGFSSIAVAGDTAYINGTRGPNESDEVIIALDADTGTEKWTAKIGPIFTFKTNIWGDGPRSTPTVDGNLIFALGGQGELVCFDRTQKDKEIWRKSLPKDLGGSMMTMWGYSESPLVDGDLLICTPGGIKGTLAALEKKTGKVVWRSTDIKQSAPYSSVVAADIQGVRQYVFNSYVGSGDEEGGFTSSVAARDGKLLWSERIFKATSYCLGPTPIVKDNLVYMTSSTGSSGGGCHLFEIGKDMKAEDLYVAKVRKKVRNTFGGVVLVGDHVYGHTENKMWFCQDFKTGQIKWSSDPRGDLSCESGTIAAADGMLYLLTDEGEVALVEANPKAFTQISSFKLPHLSKFPETRATSKKSKVWSNLAIANGRLYVRDCEYVYCYAIK